MNAYAVIGGGGRFEPGNLYVCGFDSEMNYAKPRRVSDGMEN